MTPKEKAKQIYDKINPYSHCKTDTYKLSYLLIDEIIKALESLPDLQIVGNILLDNIVFWQEVKQEIEKI